MTPRERERLQDAQRVMMDILKLADMTERQRSDLVEAFRRLSLALNAQYRIELEAQGWTFEDGVMAQPR